MNNYPEYGDNMPLLAGDLLGKITEDDIKNIIGGLKDNIEPVDEDLLEEIKTPENENENENDTDEIELKTYKNKINILDNLSDSDGIIEDLNQTSEPKIGGGNVLQILVSLIPTVFPKSYM